MANRVGSWGRKTWEDISGVYDTTRNSIRVIHDVESPFGEFLTVTRTPVIELNSSYGTSALRDIQTVTGTGSITATTSSEIRLQSGATASSTAVLESAEIGRYIPGYASEIGIGVRIPADPTGNQVITWGGISQDDEDGIYFGKDATGFYVSLLRAGVEDKVYQSSWNEDTLDGTGPSTFNINNADGHIFQINYTWYGYGAIEFGVIGTVANKQRFIPCHIFSGFDQTSLESPNLKIFAKADNGGDATNSEIYVGGRQFSIIGTYIPKFRFASDFRGSVNTSTTVVPLVSLRRKANFGNRSVKLDGFGVLATTQPHIVEIRIGGTLTGASFGTPTNHTAAETALESDKVATAITGGVVVWSQLVDAGIANRSSLSSQSVDLDIPNGSVVTLCARTVTGTGAITASNFRLREEW